MSRIEDEVCKKIQQRAEIGKKKYGVTVETAGLSRFEWLVHAQEEAMDLAIYLQMLIEMERGAEKPWTSMKVPPIGVQIQNMRFAAFPSNWTKKRGEEE